MGRLPSGYPNAVLYVDILGGQRSLDSADGQKSALIMVDGFTGWAEAVPIPDQRAETVVRSLVDCWITRYGVPEQIHSDRGTQFEASVFQRLCEELKIYKTRTTPYRPQANGKVERLNRTLVEWLRKFLQTTPTTWECALPKVLMAHRSVVSEATGFTPFRLMFGREMRLGADVGTPLPRDECSPSDYVSRLVQELETAYEGARGTIRGKRARAVDLYDTFALFRAHPVGSWVRQRLLAIPGQRSGPSKLQARYSGQLRVLRTSGPLVLVHDPGTKRSRWVHHDSLRRSSVQPACLAGEKDDSPGIGVAAPALCEADGSDDALDDDDGSGDLPVPGPDPDAGEVMSGKRRRRAPMWQADFVCDY